MPKKKAIQPGGIKDVNAVQQERPEKNSVSFL
jgi:hypothetical protein